jgi:PadR family transcriptional regulator PadR
LEFRCIAYSFYLNITLSDRVIRVSIALSDIALSDRALTDIVISIKKGGAILISSDTIRGHLDAIILRLISENDRYGYEISNEIAARTGNKYEIKEATLYAVLQRLVKKELVESYLGDVSFGSRRRYYRITSLGRAYLGEEVRNWQIARDIINIFMEGEQ